MQHTHIYTCSKLAITLYIPGTSISISSPVSFSPSGVPVVTSSHPASPGPVAGVTPSGQQP